MKTFLPKGSGVTMGLDYKGSGKGDCMVKIYRYNPNGQGNPRIDKFEVSDQSKCNTVLDVLIHIKKYADETLSFRKSCGEGSCGSCAVNVNGENVLACTKRLSDLKGKEIEIYPLPHMSVVRDLVCNMDNFFEKYKSIKPWIIRSTKSHEQSPSERKKIDGSYECVMCGACSTNCPSYWWNEETFAGPAALVQVYRWISDSRDGARQERLKRVRDDAGLYSCHSIFSCTQSCPKGLNPAQKIVDLKNMIS